MKISGYTLHGDYYLADKVIPNKTWKEACEMKDIIDLPFGKTVIAHILSKEELETIPTSEKIGCLNNGNKGWYWTSTPSSGGLAWYVSSVGGFYDYTVTLSSVTGGARLGFHKSEIKQLLDIE